MGTHEVVNQPPVLQDYDPFGADPALVEAVKREGAAWASAMLRSVGELAGSPEAMAWGVDANRNPPELVTHDRFGHRVDQVRYHPAYHRLMETATGFGLHCMPWDGDILGSHVARAAGFYLWSQVDAGHGCPISMTFSAVPAIRQTPELAQEWEPRLTRSAYDPSDRPACAKAAALAGMGMTEKQGGSDVRANTTRAEILSVTDDTWQLTGHKWFFSAPMGDVFLILAQAPGGLSCFLVPRWLEDGQRNEGMRLQRLKDKLGNRSNASSELELDGAVGRMVGEEGRGVPAIIEMVNHTRLDCVLGAAATMRQATVQALHHARHRSVFGAELVDQPLMQMVLADLVIESEAAMLTGLRLARAFDEASRGDPAAAGLRRLATAVAKYWVCKRQPMLVAEALECLGGNGYVEESILPRLFRESPLNGIWEGSGNVICLDVLRAMAREPDVVAAFFAEVEQAAGLDPRLDAAMAALHDELLDLDRIERRARRVVGSMALVLQASLMVRHSLPAAAEAFCASRLEGDAGLAFGTLPPGIEAAAIIDRAFDPDG